MNTRRRGYGDQNEWSAPGQRAAAMGSGVLGRRALRRAIPGGRAGRLVATHPIPRDRAVRRVIVVEFFDVDKSRPTARQRRPQAIDLLAETEEQEP